MREFTFAIEYEAGADPIMDVFIDHPTVVAHSLDGFVTEDRFWRIERISGPQSALDRIETVRFDDACCGESITEQRCDATRYHDVLERSSNELVLYTYLTDIRGCESVHTLAGKHLPAGLIFETRRRESTHWWRILMRSDRNVGVFYDDLGARLGPGLSFRMGHLRDASGWRQDSFTVSLPEEQEVALRASLEAGYYERPRAATLNEIADDLEIPRSTLSYRLRQAEAQLVRRYAGGDEADRWLE
ncbi:MULTISPECIES: helix-turn-helix domain-containing protein [unclassified Haladaptatus]|uniref:helix-turn-helix domain-containing protein n=1 Tax=unclassified Haladaptatus TaxID=2622732 RepID=UPI00209C65C1|nr:MULTISPECIES: helix-turn-helix domain-containing protein [unclassified Haladaptatus]MCO8246662.1 helix-turn-helix domain-containing protein [Haladaptatus sp. AB643]MCO8256214.1 helix-turn-helix domain-containing protein [Haladaptatus sp. AB618]